MKMMARYQARDLLGWKDPNGIHLSEVTKMAVDRLFEQFSGKNGKYIDLDAGIRMEIQVDPLTFMFRLQLAEESDERLVGHNED